MPSDADARLAEKLDDYRVAGVPVVWVVDAGRNTITVILSGEPARVLSASDMLDGGAVVRGFSCPVAELLNG